MFMDRFELIRIGALMHNIEDDTSFNLVLKKLIDFCFASKGIIYLEVNNIVDFLSSDDGINMTFSHSDIINCCKEFDQIYEVNGNKDTEHIMIEEEYLKKIMEKIDEKGVDYAIELFYENELDSKQKLLYKYKKVRDAIYIFLYNVLIESEIEYNKLFSIDVKQVARMINKTELAEIVNAFIQWENELKNNILYSLYNAGLEFSILTTKKNLINLETFSNKTLYLDTNVLFRLLGLNGEELSRRTETFFEKFKELGIKLKISTLTKNEFDETIKRKVQFIAENMNNSNKYTINSYERFDRNQYSVFQYYLDWKKDKENIKVTSIIPYINTVLKKIVKKFDIEIENKFNKSLIDIEELNAQVAQYKDCRYHHRKADRSIENDIKNYCYMLSLRGKMDIKSISNVDYYILSTDYELIHFDNNNTENYRVVFHPARLYSIVLRFSGRITSTELKSFIKLLKVDIKTEERLSEATRLIINDHLNFYESNQELQKPYMEALIDSQLLDQIDNADISEKREILNNIFEKVSKRRAEESEKKLNEKDIKINELSEKLQKSQRAKNIIVKLLVLLALILVINIKPVKTIIDNKIAFILSFLASVTAIASIFIPHKKR